MSRGIFASPTIQVYVDTLPGTMPSIKPLVANDPITFTTCYVGGQFLRPPPVAYEHSVTGNSVIYGYSVV